jgi:hypothetical protein
MRVSVLSDHTPPTALMEAAQSFTCAGCGGYLELFEFGGSWVAEIAHDRACLGCECSIRDEATVVIPLEDAHRTTRAD